MALVAVSPSSSAASASASASDARLKREECSRTKHDTVFSFWEILIGSSDWEDHSLGKDGVQRYRLHNLPNFSSCPALYELGVAEIPNDDRHKLHRHDIKNIIVVYLGQTNNVRTRLQKYGRVGSHLDSGKLVSSVKENECAGLFKEVFARGYSIMFRWAPMLDKKKAEKTEAELLAVFDYAWNKCGNGACRRDQILSKLDSKATSQISTISRKFQLWKQPPFGREAGIKIDATAPFTDQTGYFIPQVTKVCKSQIRFVYGNNNVNEDPKVCGVAIGNGSICKNSPALGRKMCEEDKGKKIIGTSAAISSVITTKGYTAACGFFLEDGSLCSELPAYGRKRCELHKGRRITKHGLHGVPHTGRLDLSGQKETPFSEGQPPSVGVVKNEDECNICGVVYGDGTICSNRPVLGRKRCKEHKGWKVTGTKSTFPRSRECWGSEEDGDICGVVNDGCARGSLSSAEKGVKNMKDGGSKCCIPD